MMTELAAGTPSAELPDPPARDDVLKVLGVLTRKGNTAAARLLLEEYRRDAETGVTKPSDVFDELDAIRAGRAVRAS